MTLPAVPGVLRIALRGAFGTGEWANIYHFAFSGGPATDPDCATMASQTRTAWGTNFLGAYPPIVTLTSVTVEDLTSSSAGVGAWAGSDIGTGTSRPVPANVCMLVKHTIGRRYRGGHPRTYLPGPNDAILSTPTQWDASAVATIQGFFNTFISDVETTTLPSITFPLHVSVSYFTGHSQRLTPVVDPVLGSTVETMVATQRRRVGR